MFVKLLITGVEALRLSNGGCLEVFSVLGPCGRRNSDPRDRTAASAAARAAM